jgi:hypothetical protein
MLDVKVELGLLEREFQLAVRPLVRTLEQLILSSGRLYPVHADKLARLTQFMVSAHLGIDHET